MMFFESLGVPLKTERGRRVFPVSDRALDVVLALKRYCTENGCRIVCDRITGFLQNADGTLSDMLRDRMDAGIALYKNGAVKKLLLSGDDSGEWGEVTAMKAYAIQNGVSEEDILTDGEGYSTYESVSRAKELYGIHKLVIVTQKYHLYRALYIANDMDMTALGADAALYTYAGQWYREIREMLARIKDFGLCLFN